MKTCRFPLMAALLAIPAAASAAEDADIRALREELARLRASYEKRIDALEQRLLETEAKNATTASVAARAEAAAVTPPSNPPVGANAFNPNISLILSGLYGNLSRDPAGYRITGFHLPNDPLGEITPQRGFSLAESELGISANIDQLFYGALNLAVHADNTVSTEEAFIQTSALAQGLTLKAGRHLSGIGYLNERHAHTWDFVDAPLAYQAFVGGQFGNDGLQVRWLAPTTTFLEFGAEVGRGANFPGTGRNKNGSGASALFVHTGGDLGTSNTWRAGLSLLTTSPQEREWTDIDAASTEISNRFSGSSKLWIADAVWKWAPNGNAKQTNFKLQGEYFRRRERGELTYDVSTASIGPLMGSYSATQSGWYLQGIYQFTPHWRVGLRAERLDTGAVDYGANNANLLRPDYTPSRTTAMLDYNPSEFSRIRLQFARDKSRQGAADNQIFLQYQMSLGAHGAHKF